MTFHCYRCKLPFSVFHFPVTRIALSCPTCNAPNKIDQAIRREYGNKAGELATRIMEPLEKLREKDVKWLAGILDDAYDRLNLIVLDSIKSQEGGKNGK